MVSNPGDYVKPFAEAGANQFTFHVESVQPPSISSLVAEIKATGMRVGIALKPGTAADAVFPYLESIDQVLVMTVGKLIF
jgi:ribulose-phosphate 3-epimerase